VGGEKAKKKSRKAKRSKKKIFVQSKNLKKYLCKREKKLYSTRGKGWGQKIVQDENSSPHITFLMLDPPTDNTGYS